MTRNDTSRVEISASLLRIASIELHTAMHEVRGEAEVRLQTALNSLAVSLAELETILEVNDER